MGSPGIVKSLAMLGESSASLEGVIESKEVNLEGMIREEGTIMEEYPFRKEIDDLLKS